MPSPIRLPDAMPTVDIPTLLVVCDAHRCRFLTVGGHQIAEEDALESKQDQFTDKEGQTRSPASFGKGGMTSGMKDLNPVEENRLKIFANALVKRLEQLIREQKTGELHLSAPGKFLSVVRDHLTPEIKKVTKQTVDGNFTKESPIDLLARFRPDLKDAVKNLRNQESYSPKNRPPK